MTNAMVSGIFCPAAKESGLVTIITVKLGFKELFGHHKKVP